MEQEKTNTVATSALSNVLGGVATSYHSYPKIYAIGHSALKELFLDDVLIEEKIDGSQFSFCKMESGLRCRSKGAQLNVEYPESMFREAVEIAKTLNLRDGWTYRAEYLKTPKHNSLAYDRIPEKHLIIFDVNTAEEEYLQYEEKKNEATRIGLECVPILHNGRVDNPETLLALLDTTSILGGQKIEGFVIKNYKRFGSDKKALMGKYVSENFKEVHSKEWKNSNPSTNDVIQKLILGLKTPARWNKAIQHIKERGELTQSPKDIGMLIKEVQFDIADECKEEIKDALYQFAIKHIQRGVVGGLPEWYKEELMRQQFQNRVATSA